jgi:hypothetical protein
VCHVSTSPVLLAAYAVALSPLTSSQSVAVQLVVNNRFRPGFGGSVSGDVATPAEPSSLRAELPRSTLTWGERNDVPVDKVFPYINDTTDALCYEFQADTAEDGTRAVPAMGAVR